MRGAIDSRVAVIDEAHSSGIARRRSGVRGVVGAVAARAGRPAARHHAVEFEEFRLGLDDFLEVETSDEGLGPAFNGTSCAVCHNVPAIGGVGTMSELRAGHRNADGEFEPLTWPAKRCSICSRSPRTPASRSMPPDANVIARRVPIPLFGAGLIEAIADATILALEDPVGSQPRRHQRPRGADHRHRHRRAGASAGSAGRRSTRRC